MKAAPSHAAERESTAQPAPPFPARLDRADGPWLATLLLIGVLALAGFAVHAHRVTGGQGGVPLDDAWIHFQFARNLARGDGFAFNPGEPTAGSTAPLWTLLLAGLYALGARFPLGGQVLSAASYLFALGCTYALTKALTRRRGAAWVAAAVTALNGRFVWAGLSALETPLFAALTLLAVISYLGHRGGRYRLRTAVLFALAALTRPEGVLLFALSLADSLLRPREPRRDRSVRGLVSRATRLLPAVGVFAALVLPYVVFSLRSSGQPLPNTFSAKATFNFRPDLDFLGLAAIYLILDNPLLVPFLALGFDALLSRAPLLIAWSFGLPPVYAFLHATLYQHGRYLIPLIPFNAVIGIAGLLQARRLALRQGWRWPVSRAWGRMVPAILVLGATAWRLPTMAGLYGRNVQNINHMQVAIGRWVAEHTPEDVRLALNDIGAITYLSERHIVDLAGLVTPEVTQILRAEDRTARLIALMADRGVDYVIIFPDWFPGLAARTDLLEPVHRVTLQDRTITGGTTMVVYRADWSSLTE